MEEGQESPEHRLKMLERNDCRAIDPNARRGAPDKRRRETGALKGTEATGKRKKAASERRKRRATDAQTGRFPRRSRTSDAGDFQRQTPFRLASERVVCRSASKILLPPALDNNGQFSRVQAFLQIFSPNFPSRVIFSTYLSLGGFVKLRTDLRGPITFSLFFVTRFLFSSVHKVRETRNETRAPKHFTNFAL